MIIIKKGGSFRKINFDGVITYKDGTVIDAGLITETSPVELSGTLESSYIISFAALSDYQIGDSIKVTGPDGIPRNNLIKAIGDNKVEVEELINNNIGDTVTIKNAASIVQLDSSIDNGVYFFRDAETLLISEVFLNISIPYAEMKSEYNGLSPDYNVELNSKTAINSILLDFSFDASFTSVMDIGQLKGLIILKMVQKIESGKGDNPITRADKNYNKALTEVINKIRIKDNKLQNTEVMDADNNNDNSISFSNGV